ncbi:MAG: ferritin-like domain-containing protein [Inquilinus sp.]|uniref:YciE/YciF ferroxidase family protein n=1 Tax=Inquilinus sp. TaxID=1932117 RepID=UPI003F2BFDF5
MSKQTSDLSDLFYETLKDIYFAEKQILSALPEMAENAQSDELRTAFETHRDETRGQIERLDQIFELIGKPTQEKTCVAIVGMIDESKEVMEDFADTNALDAGILAAAQAVEHYEISRYGTLKTWAQQLGLTDVVGLLEDTLMEEKKTDELLSKLASADVNAKAA